jgi:hypothetical protein
MVDSKIEDQAKCSLPLDRSGESTSDVSPV